MSEYIINGIHCTSEVYNTKTGETKPYDRSMHTEIMKSYLSRLSVAQIEAMPASPTIREADIDVFLSGDKVTVKDHVSPTSKLA